ncbi:hypothetical protein, partial [Burkholderia sp. SIMBA_019]
TVVLLSSHHAFGWPSTDRIPFSFQGSSEDSNESADDGDVSQRRADGDAAMLKRVNVPDFRVDGDRFVLQPQPGTHMSIVT